jgi:hypothetical protein
MGVEKGEEKRNLQQRPCRRRTCHRWRMRRWQPLRGWRRGVGGRRICGLQLSAPSPAISRGLVSGLPPDFQSPLPPGRGGLFTDMTSRSCTCLKYVRTLSVAIEVSGIGSILSLRLPLHFGMRPRKISQPYAWQMKCKTETQVARLKCFGWVPCILAPSSWRAQGQSTNRTNVQSSLRKKNILGVREKYCTMANKPGW